MGSSLQGYPYVSPFTSVSADGGDDLCGIVCKFLPWSERVVLSPTTAEDAIGARESAAIGFITITPLEKHKTSLSGPYSVRAESYGT